MNDPVSSDDAKFLADVRAVLDTSALPDGVPERLAAARRAAVAAVEPRRNASAPPAPWIPVAALATTVLAVAVAITATDTHVLPVVDDARALAAAQDLELLEDLEFLAWLDDDAYAG